MSAPDGPEIELLAPSLAEAAGDVFVSDATHIWRLLAALADNAGIPEGRVRLVLADDFTSEVNRWMPAWTRREEGGAFTTTREGGVVAAKNLDQSADASDVVIVFDASLWTEATEPYGRAHLANLVAHELTHPLIERLRHVSGAMDGVLIPSVTGTESARSMARIDAGEYRADRIAELVVGTFITTGTGPDEQPFRTWPFKGQERVASIGEVLGRAISAWPDIVDDYREWRIPLEVMFQQVAGLVDQTLTALVHVQAAADAATDDTDVLALPELADSRATQLYLADTFPPFIQALRSVPLLPKLEEVKDVEDALVRAGETMILEIWRRLGLTVIEHGGRRWGLRVKEPVR